MKIRVLIIMGRYLPGYKDGGPVRSIKNLTEFIGDEYEFYILTADRDHGDLEPYPNIIRNDWNQVGKAKVYYVEPKGFKKELIIKFSKGVNLIYLCGCFNDYSINTLIAKKLKKIDIPVVIAAMGLFSPLEFRRKYLKKKIFTEVFNITGMFKHIYWSATSEMEVHEIEHEIKVDANHFFIAEDLPRLVDKSKIHKAKKSGELSVCWISRISPKKNLLKAIEILNKVKSNISFTIFGPVQDSKYWVECKNQLENLNSNIRWSYAGIMESEFVVEKLKKQHVFLFPTKGENYGHVIQEALSAGCPCILSDQTPWQDLEDHGVGYVHELENTKLFVEDIENYAGMDENTFNTCVDNAHNYAIRNSNDKVSESGYRTLFNEVIKIEKTNKVKGI